MNCFATLLLTNLTRPQGKTVWQSACVLQQYQHSNARHYDHASKGVVILSRRRRILVEEHKDPSLTASPQ